MSGEMEAEPAAPEAVPDAETVIVPEGDAIAPEPFKRLKKPVKPSKDEHLAAVEALSAQLKKQKARLEEIKKEIETKKGPKGGSSEMQQARAKLNELNGRFKAELAKKSQIKGDLDAANKGREQMRNNLRDMKSQMLLTTVEKVDDEIARLEYTRVHSTLNIREEKKVLEDIKKLKSARGKVAQYNEQIDRLNSSDEVREKIFARLKACDEEVSAIKAEEESVRAELQKSREQANQKNTGWEKLHQEKEELKEVMAAIWQKIQDLRDEFKAENQTYWDEMQIFKKQLDAKKKIEDEINRKEREEKNKERAAKAAENAGEPYYKEVTLCEQLINHLGKYRQQEEQAASSAPAAQIEAPDGFKAVKKKGDEEEFGAFFGSSGGKKGKGKKGKGGREEKASDQKLSHSIDIISAFSTLKVEMPLTASKVPAALQEVEARKAYWLQKRATAVEKGETPVEEAEPSTSKAKAPQANGVGGKKGKANGVVDFTAEEWPDFQGNVTRREKAGENVKGNSKEAVSEALTSVALKVADEEVTLQITVQ